VLQGPRYLPVPPSVQPGMELIWFDVINPEAKQQLIDAIVRVK
jgi:hypothetical protein